MFRLKILLPLIAAGVALLAYPTYAHGFGERYDLPVPMGYFIAGAGGAVALSFVVVGWFVRSSPGQTSYPRYNLFKHRWVQLILMSRVSYGGLILMSAWPGFRSFYDRHRWLRVILWNPSLVDILKLFSVFVLGLLIATGLFGSDDPASNLTTTFVWIIWWVGMGFFVALIGNLWVVVNPWKALYEGAEWVYTRFVPGGSLSFNEPYPENWGIWPAAIIFICFSWAENVYSDGDLPARIALMIIAYSFLTLGGMTYFGKHAWLKHCEGFSVIFSFLSRFSPTEVRVHDWALCAQCGDECQDQDGECIDCYQCFEGVAFSQVTESGGSDVGVNAVREFNIRPFAVGLSRYEWITNDVMAVVILLLATVTFDGFAATSAWVEVQDLSTDVFPGIPDNSFFNSLTITNTLGLLLFPVAFLMVYLSFTYAMARLVGNTVGLLELAKAFVFTLIPIALAYNIAHFVTLLIIQGQLIIPLVSDPFGRGWDLFGTSDYQIDIGVIGAKDLWFLSIGVIVAGHMIAVYLAHRISMRLFGDRRLAMKSQYPMLALMVIYTMVSLWIIGQPIVN